MVRFGLLPRVLLFALALVSCTNGPDDAEIHTGDVFRFWTVVDTAPDPSLESALARDYVRAGFSHLQGWLEQHGDTFELVPPQAAAIAFLELALNHWREYATVASSQYEVQLMARTSYTDWNGRLLDLARDDIRIAREARPGAFPPSAMAWKEGGK